MSAWLFAGSVFMIFFAYFGYPLSLKLLRSRHAPVQKMSILPSVTFIIAAYNEAKSKGIYEKVLLYTGREVRQRLAPARGVDRDRGQKVAQLLGRARIEAAKGAAARAATRAT